MDHNVANIAAIDIGTNSIHLVVARPSANRRFEVLAREKDVVRLGSGSGDMKHLSEDAITRAVETLGRFRQIAEVWEAEIVAVATSATREALNRDEFINRASDEAGVEVAVISGIEEARLIHLGVLQAVPVYDAQVLVIDIGGGSTELVVSNESRRTTARSLKLGAMRLTDRFFPEERVKARAIDACRDYVRAFLSPVTRDINAHGFDIAVGSSGTIASAISISAASRGQEPHSLNAQTLTRADLDAVVAMVASARTAAARRKIAGLEPKRVDIILAGLILLEQLVAELGIEEITYSEYALREGVLLNRISHAQDGQHHLSHLRRESVLHVATMFLDDLEHPQHTARLAAELWEQTVDIHDLGTSTLELLEAAAILHNVGLFVSHSSHHRHSYYLIRNCEHLTGFTNREIEIIALIARYHRKSSPKLKHAEFARLPTRDQRIVRVLAGILRVAIALDRTSARVVERVDVHANGGRLSIRVAVRPGSDPSLEIYTAQQRKDPLAEALGMKIDVSVMEPDAAG
jgi:exopolyphosphatase/guanosine-5'-triphosphate,3'-diphosphate pyrophosphatase